MPSPATPPLLSLCMIVRNERATLATCLASVRDLVDEMIVVDTGSDDGTPEIARQHGAQVIPLVWDKDFARARNRSLEAARGRWILVLDADEYLVDRDKQAIRALLAQHTPAEGAPQRAFTLVQKSTSDGGRTGMLVSIIRLFPNRPDIRFSWPIHEQVNTALERAKVPVETTDIVFLHTGYSDPARNLQKQRRNGEILAAQIASGVDVTPLTHFLLAGCHLDLGEFDAALHRYEETRRLALARSDTEMAHATTIRIAGCLAKLGRFAEIPPLVADGEPPLTHPQFLNLRALAETKLGRADAGCAWRERVLACADHPRIPACNVVHEKIAALQALGEYWYHRGAKPRALALLRLAVSLQKEPHDLTPADLTRLYAETP